MALLAFQAVYLICHTHTHTYLLTHMTKYLDITFQIAMGNRRFVSCSPSLDPQFRAGLVPQEDPRSCQTGSSGVYTVL